MTLVWTHPSDVDGQLLAASLGIRTYTGAREHTGYEARSDADQVERPLAADVQAAHAVPAAAPDGRSLERWFEDRYGASWECWMEEGIGVMAAGGQRLQQASLLAMALRVTTESASHKHRLLSQILGGEVGGLQTVREHEATIVLGRMAQDRAVRVPPNIIRSLRRAALAVRNDPSLVGEAGLDEATMALVAEVAQEADRVELLTPRGPGRPPLRAWSSYRDVAVGRVAGSRGTTAAEKLDLFEQIRATVDSAIEAIHDALNDRERSCEVGVNPPTLRVAIR